MAWQLSRRGLSVTVADQNAPSNEATANEQTRATSWAGVGILPPANLDTAVDPIDKLRALSHRLYPDWSETLREATSIDNGYSRCGGIYLAATRGEAATLIAQAEYWREYRIQAEPLDAKTLRDLEPHLRQVAEKEKPLAWHVPDEAQVRSPAHLAALRAACDAEGVQFLEATKIQGFAPRSAQHQADAVLTESGRLSAAMFCICGGAWSQSLLSDLELTFDVYPVRGQVILFKLPSPPLTRIVNEGNRYLAARDDGHVLVGSNEEEVGFEYGTTPEVIDALRRWACGVLPLLSTQPIVKRWCGFRPASFDGFPYIGKTPGIDNVFVATGHFRSGIHLSCATATELSALMLGDTPLLDLSPFSPSRAASW